MELYGILMISEEYGFLMADSSIELYRNTHGKTTPWNKMGILITDSSIELYGNAHGKTAIALQQRTRGSGS